MKKKILIPLTLWILWPSCQNISDQTQNTIKDTFTQKESIKQHMPKITYDISLSYEQQQIIEDVVKGYISFYPCVMKTLTISADTPEDKENENTLAHSDSHCVYLDPEDLRDNTSLKNTMIHELFHTIKNDSLTLTTPYKLKDGYTIIGYHGLSIIVQNGKQQTKFGVFEDAASEACASIYDTEYTVPNVYYSNIGSLMLKIIHKWWLTSNDLIRCQSSNNVDLLCEKIFNKKNTKQDIEILMQIFNDVYSTDQDVTDEAIKKIEKIR